MTNKNKKSKVISSKYVRGEDYNDNILNFTDPECPDPREVDDERMKMNTIREFKLSVFPDPDW